MGFRGGKGKFGKNRAKHQNKKPKQKQQRSRKTYSLYPNKENGKFGNKRKFDPSEDKLINNKHMKKEEMQTIIPEDPSSESEGEVDYMKELLSTFKNTTGGSVAVISDEESDTSDLDESDGNEDIDQIKVAKTDGVNSEDDELDHQETDVSDKEDEVEGDSDNSEENDDDDSDVQESNRLELIPAEAETKNDHNKDNNKNEHDENIYDINEIDVETEKEDENLESCTDPFAKHLFFELGPTLLNSVQSTPMIMNTTSETWSKLGKLVIQIPEGKSERSKKTLLFDEQIYASTGTIPQRIHLSKETFASLHVKTQIINNLERANKSLSSSDKTKSVPLTSLQGEMFSIINNYQDLYFPERTFDNEDEIRFIYCLHAVNHILKTRTKVLHHNARLSKKDDVPEEFRDQGLVRPKIVMIVPFKAAAYKIVQTLISILIAEDKGNVANKKRFVDEYTGNELMMPKKNPKPEDYEMTFSGNTSDDFKIGITITKKTLKLYAAFYSSDIIIASPLGLRTIIGAEGEPERDFDFLASVELLIFDQMEIFLMQNWDHVLHIMNHIHLQPKESHGTDISRVRHWSLNGWAKYYRQTLIFSSVVLPEIHSIFNKRCYNYRGKVKIMNEITCGLIRQVFVQLPHVFQKISVNSVEQSIDARFDFFINKILPQHRDPMMKQTIIYVPSYFDYVRLRNYFKREDISFVQICEYSKDAKVARARDMFFHGDAHFLLYTERHHFFNRIRIKGIRHLIFYQLPTFPNFYNEICNLMMEANMNRKVGSISYMTVTVLYTKYDVYQLSAVISTERAAKMVQSEQSVHLLEIKN